MGLTVSSSASQYYKLYSLSNTATYKANTVDSSSVSKENYNVSSLSNALDSLNKTDTASFSSITNVNSFAKNSYNVSQLSNYKTLSNSTSLTNANNLLSNKANYSGIYEAINSTTSLNYDSLESMWNTYAAKSTSLSFSGYLNKSGLGKIMDLFV